MREDAAGVLELDTSPIVTETEARSLSSSLAFARRSANGFGGEARSTESERRGEEGGRRGCAKPSTTFLNCENIHSEQGRTGCTAFANGRV